MDRFPPGVEAAISEVFPSDDPLDDPDFNATDYINQVKEGSLSEIEAKTLVKGKGSFCICGRFTIYFVRMDRS